MNIQTPNDRLRILRENLGISQTAFSEILGFKQSYISAVESGKKEVTAKVINALIEHFQVSANWLIKNDGGMFINESYITNKDNSGFPKNGMGENRYIKKLNNENKGKDKDSSLQDENLFKPGDRRMTKKEAQLRLLELEYDKQKGDFNNEISPVLGGLLYLRLAGDKLNEIAAALHLRADNEMLNILNRSVEKEISKEEAFKQLDDLNENLHAIMHDGDLVEKALCDFAFTVFLHFEELRGLIEGSVLDKGQIKFYDEMALNGDLTKQGANNKGVDLGILKQVKEKIQAAKNNKKGKKL